MLNKAIITVLDSINPTTMPYNEFVLYRNSHYKNEKQILLLTGSEIIIPKNNIPSNLEIHKVGKNPFEICSKLKSIILKCKERKISYIIHLHSMRGSFSTFIAMFLCKISKRNTIYTIHSTFTGFKIHNKILTCLNSLFSNYVTCVSKTAYYYFPKIIKKLKRDKIKYIQNSVNTERIDNILTGYKSIKNNDFIYFSYIARMVPVKNHKFLINVLKKCLSNIKFIFIGAEDRNGIIRKYAEEQGVLDKIEFTGLIPREEVYKKIADSDYYISSSTLEGLPVSALEAMYCGKPMILSDIPQHKEIADVCSDVQLLPLDIEIWIKAINKYSLMPEKERYRRGLNCKNSAFEFFSLRKMHEKYDEIYEKINKPTDNSCWY